MTRTYTKYSLSFLFIIIADRLTKLWALQTCILPQRYNDYFSCELVFNRGISWSLLSFTDSCYFGCVTALVTGIIIALGVYTWHQRRSGFTIIGETIVLAGSCANLYDRHVYGGVIDFIMLSYKSYTWPLFNIADVAIVCGVLWMLFNFIRQPSV